MALGLLFSFEAEVHFKPSLAPKPDEHDGRFTMGAEEKSVLFGYPLNYSSSHFILSSNGRYASNNPAFYQKLVKYIQGSILETTSDESSARSSTTYSFDNLSINQRLIPLSSDLKEIGSTGYGQAYRIEYEITNAVESEHNLAFSLMLDVKLGDNDGVVSKCGGKSLVMDKRIEGNTPLDYSFEHNNKVLHIKQDTAHSKRATMVCYGQWSLLKNLLDMSHSQTVKHSTNDAALLLHWKATLKKNEKITFSVILSSNLPQLTMQHHDIKRVIKDTIYFAAGSSALDSLGRQKLGAFIRNYRMRGILIEGYTDATGSEEKNLELAKKRIAVVSTEMQQLGAQYRNILTKSHGEFYATDDAHIDPSHKRDDRKVVLTGWK